jgi:hypothetical protein
MEKKRNRLGGGGRRGRKPPYTHTHKLVGFHSHPFTFSRRDAGADATSTKPEEGAYTHREVQGRWTLGTVLLGHMLCAGQGEM